MSEFRCQMCGFRAPAGVFVHGKDGSVKCPRCRGPSVPSDAQYAGQAFGPDEVVSPFMPASYFGLVTSPQDVRTEKESLAPFVQSTDVAVQACKVAISQRPGGTADLAGWQAWRDGFATFYNAKSSIASASGDLARALGFRSELHDWQDRFEPNCPGIAPVPSQSTQKPPPPPGGSWWDNLFGTANKWATVATVAAVVGGGVLIYIVYKNMQLTRELAPSLLDKVKVIPV
jgi:hypothetical protein